ncbi:MAG: helix-turn-helix domain-containing protein [bacterium]|nr:helix-turn-helix domain-containing protein [bacterium]
MEVFEPAEALFERAGEKTRKRVEADLGLLPGGAQMLLRRIVTALETAEPEVLLACGFDARRFKRACRDTPANSADFRAVLGCEPWEYLDRLRIEVAKELLRYRDLEIWRIASFSGFDGIQQFCYGFKKATGTSATQYRKTQKPLARRKVPATELNSDAFYLLATVGALEPAQLEGFKNRIRARFLEPAPEPGLTLRVRGNDIEARFVEHLWEYLEPMPPDERHRRLALLPCDSPAFFHLVIEKMRGELRRSGRRCLELAELALGYLEVNAGLLDEELPRLRALGLAWLANARRLTGDHVGAGESLAQAWDEWRAGGEDEYVAAEICRLEATLRLCQRRTEEGLELLGRSIALATDNGYTRVLVSALLTRVAVLGPQEKIDATMDDLRTAQRELAKIHDPALELNTCGSLAMACVVAGRYHEALELLPRAYQLCEELEEQVSRHQLHWSEGLARKGLDELGEAERLLRKAQCGLVEHEALDSAAEVSLDLAILYSERGRSSDVAALAAEAILLLECLMLSGEAVAAPELLRQAIVNNELTLDILAEARGCLGETWRQGHLRVSAEPPPSLIENWKNGGGDLESAPAERPGLPGTRS